MYCEKCGTKLADDDSYCCGCGSKIKKSIITTLKSNNKKSKKIVIGTICVIVCMFVLLLLITWDRGSDKRDDNSYVADSKENLQSSFVNMEMQDTPEEFLGDKLVEQEALEEESNDVDDVFNNGEWIFAGTQVADNLKQDTSQEESKVSKQRVIADMPDELFTLTIDLEASNLKLEFFEITKRLTEGRNDEISGDLVLSNDKYRVNCTYMCEYKLYDVGGWILEDDGIYNATITCLEEIPNVISPYVEWKQIYYMDQVFEVQDVSAQRLAGDDFMFTYDVLLQEKYCTISGQYKAHHYLERHNMNVYSWKEEESSELTYDWDIVGSYVGETTSVRREVIIDAYNPVTGEVHIAYYKCEEDYPWIGGEKLFVVEDITVIADYSEPKAINDYSISMGVSFQVKEGRYDSVWFDIDSVSSEIMKLRRVE